MMPHDNHAKIRLTNYSLLPAFDSCSMMVIYSPTFQPNSLHVYYCTVAGRMNLIMPAPPVFKTWVFCWIALTYYCLIE